MAVRIGFIGSGGIAGSHLSALVDNPDAEVVALCDVSADSIERTRASVNRRATNGGLGRTLDAATYDEPSRMLRDERLDAVYLCLPPFVHGEPEEAVIAAGLPMLVEKPVALDLGTAARLLGQIRDREIMAASGYQYRYTQYLARAQQLLEGKTIGQALVTRFGGTPGTPWYHRQELSGGQIIEMATHQMDMLRALVGEVRTVYAAGATRINNREKPEYDIYDVNSITLIFENGAIGSFAANFVVEYRMHLESWGLHVFCDDLLVSLTDAVRASTSEGLVEEFPLDDEPMAVEDRAFVRAVAEGRPELIKSDYESAVRTLAVTLAADRSARTGKPVDVPSMLAEEAPALGRVG